MTTHWTQQPPLVTADDVTRRVEELIGAAVTEQIWYLMTDADGLQLPVLPSVETIPEPEPGLVGNLVHIVDDILDSSAPGGRVVFVLERPGAVVPTDRDVTWADALRPECLRQSVHCAGIYSSTEIGVRLIPPTPGRAQSVGPVPRAR
ncbi:hypothetical protein FK531_21745 [Rhodococcus spelaei]|uniref:Uncharacterized protein n=1 Tax=Rhodococcus spelaei TaxID=2546320 RepID=A0A541AZJ1_9NOCA|nr:hypothetical protein [Rhodococcus spelaei]TQF65489.1 hypothetical protein FK531_21745 [Rhodococcus spelaei]